MISLIFFCLFSFWINILLTRLGQDLTISKRGLRRLIFSIENHINIHDDASQEDSILKKKRREGISKLNFLFSRKNGDRPHFVRKRTFST
jgi:hypothetical protein